MDRSIFRYILRYSARQQVVLTLMAAFSFPFLYAFYELPKLIINEAIQGDPADFPVEFFGLEFDQIETTMILSGGFLALVVVNQSFKYVINVYKGITGERMLRRLRFELYGRVLRFPLPTFKKVSQGEIIPMVTAEVEPLGGFIGDAFSLPAFQGGTMIVIISFLMIQNWMMALAAISLYPIQIYIIPRLQRRVNALGKERVRRVRKLSDRIGETVQGVQEVHANDTSNLELAIFSHQLGDIFRVRYQIYRKKFVIKFLNNFIQQLGPFFFYSIGGYFVIAGQLEIGTLVAAIAAHKDLAGPWKELLNYYQMKEDARIKYDQVVSQFDPAHMREPEYQHTEPEGPVKLSGDVAVANLILADEQETNIIDSVSFSTGLDQRVAVVGDSGSGKEHMALLLARLLDPDKGRITVGGVDWAVAPESVTGRRISFVGQNPFIFNATLGDNLFYGLKHRPLQPADYSGKAADEMDFFVNEAKRSANSTDDPNANWIDYAAAGSSGDDDLKQEAMRVVEMVALENDIYSLGLRGTIDPDKNPDLATAILSAREALRDRLKDPEFAPLVEGFDKDSYNTNASVAENLLFGNPVGDAFNPDRLAENEYVLSILDKVGLTDTVLSVGYQVAATMVELFADLPPDHEFFEQFAFISSEDLPEFQALLSRASKDNLGELKDEDRTSLMSLPFKLIPARHRLGLIDDDMRAKLLEARAAFAAGLPDDLQGKIAFFDAEAYNPAANLQDNILFGKVAYGQAHAADRVGELISEVIDSLNLRRVVAEVGLAYDAGIAGSRLSAAQRQKLGIARAVIKHPDLLVVSEATAALDAVSQARIMETIIDEYEGRGLIWVLHRADMARYFDRVLVMRTGRVVESGTPEELDRDGTAFRELVAAE